jgi:autotransporter translocation and assembly factor TamB
VDKEWTDSSERVPPERYGTEYVRANRLPAKRYYTERLQIRTDEGPANGLARAAIDGKLSRGWKLVGAVLGPEEGTVELTWLTTEG